VLAYRYAGQRYDCGSKLGYLKATAAMGLKHPETAAGFAHSWPRAGNELAKENT
jgi:UTP--glucose-1-phosphate uridylyltransferase